MSKLGWVGHPEVQHLTPQCPDLKVLLHVIFEAGEKLPIGGRQLLAGKHRLHLCRFLDGVVGRRQTPARDTRHMGDRFQDAAFLSGLHEADIREGFQRAGGEGCSPTPAARYGEADQCVSIGQRGKDRLVLFGMSGKLVDLGKTPAEREEAYQAQAE